MRRTFAAGVVMATLMAAGCASRTAAGSGSGPASGPTTTQRSAPVPTRNDCSAFTASLKADDFGNDQSGAGSLPADARPVSLLRCVQDVQDVPGQGQWQVVQTVRSTGSVDAFVSALRASYVKPPEPKPKGSVACADIAYLQPWIALVDAGGRAYRIEIPRWGVCGEPDPDVTKALAAVKTTVVSAERIRQTTSAGAQASGCPQQFAEMAFVDVQAVASGTARPFFSGLKPGQPIRACYYKLGGAYEKVKPAGDFDAVATLSGSQAAVVYDGLMGAPVATVKTCAAPASEYAVLSGTDGSGNWSVVELGGCGLAGSDSGPSRTAPAAVVQALLAAKA